MRLALANGTSVNVMQADALKVFVDWDLEHSCHDKRQWLSCWRQLAHVIDSISPTHVNEAILDYPALVEPPDNYSCMSDPWYD